MPLGRRELRQDGLELGAERGGDDGLSEDAEPAALRLPARLDLFGQFRGKDVPGAGRARAEHDFRAIRIVQREDGGLREDIRGAEASRVQRVALDLGGSTLVTFDE